jgi:hypothetical protein
MKVAAVEKLGLEGGNTMKTYDVGKGLAWRRYPGRKYGWMWLYNPPSGGFSVRLYFRTLRDCREKVENDQRNYEVDYDTDLK